MKRTQDTTMSESLEHRVEALEAEIRELKEEVRQKKPARDWSKIVGWAADDPDYEEAMRLGREYREKQRIRVIHRHR